MKPSDERCQLEEKGFHVIISGPEAAVAAAEIKKIISEKFHCHISIRPVEDHDHVYDEQHKPDPVAAAAFILVIPGSVLAADQPAGRLMARLKKREDIENTIEKIQKEIVCRWEVSVQIKYPCGAVKELTSCCDSPSVRHIR
ncbi:MAG: hypothetical protein ACL93V_12305 [Candidatus Electrothrix sp. YB6]